MDNENNDNRIQKIEDDLKQFKHDYSLHMHTQADGTPILKKNIILDRDQSLIVGVAQAITATKLDGSATEEYAYALSVGGDTQTTGFVYKSVNMQMNFRHYPNDTNSFVQIYRKPLVTSLQGTSVTTTAAGNTVTITGFNFVTNELAGGLIDIFSSAGALVETQVIASNTATVVTIVGTWLNTTSGGTFLIYRPVFFGSADVIFQRFYTQEGTVGGLRFGMGPTNGGQNGLLYMDAAGDLFWRNKGGTSAQINGAGTTPVVNVYTAGATWSKPAGLKYVTVEVVGGGGKGSAASGAPNQGGGGGGGGGYSRKTIAVGTLGATETVTVGGGSTGSGGGTSSFGSHLSATGGTDSSGTTVPGVGGQGSSGDVNSYGQNGGLGDGSRAMAGIGGASVLGGGGGVSAIPGAGSAGGNYGGGGGGGVSTGSNANGGNGGIGVVIVTEYY